MCSLVLACAHIHRQRPARSIDFRARIMILNTTAPPVHCSAPRRRPSSCQARSQARLLTYMATSPFIWRYSWCTGSAIASALLRQRHDHERNVSVAEEPAAPSQCVPGRCRPRHLPPMPRASHSRIQAQRKRDAGRQEQYNRGRASESSVHKLPERHVAGRDRGAAAPRRASERQPVLYTLLLQDMHVSSEQA